ncbi:NADH-quinone oxidoreductase subunit E [Aliishimia ponticola]|uniref:NADH-quinone oxidoreductase subunit E n=1 Tax=Aliishimia ponticola TaxID=2499833 RepID=A0A4S4NJA8_9RHOB|nr:NADH-quinone oxidoreductase subunit E [Aliishimia ponticola]THH38995.1 NADH-quinone oxidoreductase subunit E [Aliishimia ponticola]
MLRRLYHDQPETFAFTPDNRAWAEAQITKYPEGREASAIIPLLWRAQEQEGWLSRPAIEYVADMLGMAYIRALEVASFYFMFQLQPVGKIAHFQICGTTSCMICGAEDLMEVCKKKIAAKPHEISADGKFSWEEVECLGACSNAPMAQIGKDYYEDLTADRFAEIIDELADGKVPTPGPQNGRYASEPLSGLTSLTEFDSGQTKFNASVQLADDIGETVKRIDGTEVPLVAPWGDQGGRPHGEARVAPPANDAAAPTPKKPSAPERKVAAAPVSEAQSKAKPTADPSEKTAPKSKGKAAAKPKAKKADAKPVPAPATAPTDADRPAALSEARGGQPDDLKLIKGVGPKLEALLHSMGFFHFDQVAAWTETEVAWVDDNLKGFKGRVSRDNWVEQAKSLAEGKPTEFSQRAQKDGIYKS